MQILFVCRGNTCRSPMAEGVMRHELSALNSSPEFHIESAGTHAGTVKRGADPRAQAAIAHRGVNIDGHVSRSITPSDFNRFDLIIALDSAVLATLEAAAPQGHSARLVRLMDFAPQMGTADVPDPWYGTSADYEHALDLISEGVHGLIGHLTQTP